MPQERLVQATLSPLTPGDAFSAVTAENEQKRMENRRKISRGLKPRRLQVPLQLKNWLRHWPLPHPLGYNQKYTVTA
jgi:hypothetical protein